MRAADLAAMIPSAKRRGARWDALCPAHDDTRPSLTFHDDAARGRVGLLCRRGCGPDAIAAALGLSLAELRSETSANASSAPMRAPAPRVVAQYEYRDEHGRLLYIVDRLEPKAFRQKRPDDRGDWIYNLDGVRRVLFGLPELLRDQARVFIVEGEKDVLALCALGLVATCNPMGAGKWHAQYAAQLRDAGVRELVVLPDHDEPGRKHAEMVARSCAAVGLKVKVLALPGLADKGDVTDYLSTHAKDDLLALVEAAPAWTAAKASSAPAPTVWARAKTAAELLAVGVAAVEWVDFPLVARGSLTAINAPRGTGKSAVLLARAVARARAGVRVLFLDRDNSPSTLRKRLVGLGARDVPTLKVLTRDSAPPLGDVAAWRAFPLEDFDVVVVDSWDSFAEGAGEQDSRRSTLALAPLLDIVRRERAPGVVLLCNVRKDGAAGRGSGIVEDRMDNVWEARDATGFVPRGRCPWWEDLPPAARSEWASRATRRSGRDRPARIRLALIASKFRDADDPAPIVLEPDFTLDPWAVRDVTAELVAAGDASRAAELAEVEAARERAAEALAAELARRAADGARPLLVKPAEALLVAHDLKRRAARELLRSGGGGRWRLEAMDGRAVRVSLIAPPRVTPYAAQSEGGGICTGERGAGFPHAADRMDTVRPDSDLADPAKNAGGRVPADWAVSGVMTPDADDLAV